MSDTINMMAEEFKIAYPLTYDAIYKKGEEAVIEEVLRLPRNTYKTYEHGFVENEEAIFVSDILDLKEKKNNV